MSDLIDVKSTKLVVDISRGLKLAVSSIARLERETISETVRAALYDLVRRYSSEAYRNLILHEVGEKEPDEIVSALELANRIRLTNDDDDIPF